MTLSEDLVNEPSNELNRDVRDSSNSISRNHRKYDYLAVFCAAVILFAGVAWKMGLPGADTNGRDTYNVITRLARTLTYTLSRTPGQPVLDYCNYVFRSLGGDFAVQAWFVVVSSAGITAFYCMISELGGVSPILATLALALNPFFLTHVGGVGDFAVSTSFLLISLFFANRRIPLAAGAMLALAVGCRLVFCVYVIPVSVLVVLASHSKGTSLRQCLRAGAITAAVAALLSTIEYAPSLSFWGRNLLHNLPYQGLKYHTSSFLFKLFIALGAPVWILLGALCISLARRARRSAVIFTNSAAVITAILVSLCCMAYFFRVPTKPELTLPILISVILLVQFCATSRWAAVLMLGSIAVGCVVFSPYDRGRDKYVWHFEEGWYRQNYKEAYQNRFQLQVARSFLSTLPPKSILITRQHWTIEQSEVADLESVKRLAGVELWSAHAFHGLGPTRLIVDPQEGNLRDLLERVTTNAGPDDRMTVVYEKTYLGLLRRWSHLDLAQYGSPVELGP